MTGKTTVEAAMHQARLVYLVDADAQWGKTLGLQLHYFGYDVRGFLHPRDLAAALKQQRPDVLLINMQFAEGEYAGAEAVNTLRQAGQLVCPVVFVCANDAFDARLHAVRAGAAACFAKPLDVVELVDRLERLHEIREAVPYKVQIIDDNASTAQLYAQYCARLACSPGY